MGDIVLQHFFLTPLAFQYDFLRSAECGKRGVWKTRSVKNAECGKKEKKKKKENRKVDLTQLI